MNEFGEMKTQTVYKQRVGVTESVSEVVLMDAQIREWEDVIRNRMQYQLEGFVLGGCPREVSVSVDYPASWWQAFKVEVLSRTTRNAWTRLVQSWHQRLITPKLRTARKSETVYANICPHGVIDVPKQRHLDFLTFTAGGNEY